MPTSQVENVRRGYSEASKRLRHACGMTTSQVSMETCPKPSSSALSTSGAEPWVNHSVSRRRMSCRLEPLRSLACAAAQVNTA